MMEKFPNNKYWLNQIIKRLGINREVKNYQIRYKFIKNTKKLKYLVVKVKFIGFSVKMKIYN
ncbi:hypothetical protein MKD34_12195 (plasmid) [Cetobacterium somerae]|uniref:hypothetical protein n=1 Tax=Cetobacterium somerae TaxID=188913 RepID=UPI001F062E03|nr:hypothetical protein [Cetobacterium somerae]UPO98388.1 hypothetical protein MKD34_12195 [Cetobacterium somerae]